MPKRGESAPVGATATKTAPASKTAGAQKVVEKFPTTEKLKKFLEKAEKGLSKQLFNVKEIEAGKQGEQKNRIVFFTFAENPAKEDQDGLTPEEDQFNVQKIKDVLFHYHTMEFEQAGTVIVLQVSRPMPDDPSGYHLLSYQEYKDN